MSSNDDGLEILSYILLAIIMLVVGLFWTSSTVINDRDAVSEYLKFHPEEPVAPQIMEHSNTTMVVGDPHDVRFTLLVGGKLKSWRCENSRGFGPIICREYD